MFASMAGLLRLWLGRRVVELAAQLRERPARVLDVSVGIITTDVALLIETTDPDVLHLALGRPMGMHRDRGPGPASFWREWHPPMEQEPARPRSGPGGMWSVSSEASFTVTGYVPRGGSRRRRAAQVEDEPQPIMDRHASAVALPNHEELAFQGSSGGGGGPFPRPSDRIQEVHELQFDTPPDDARGVEVALDGLTLFRFGSERVVIISATLAQRLFPGKDPLNRQLMWTDGVMKFVGVFDPPSNSDRLNAPANPIA